MRNSKSYDVIEFLKRKRHFLDVHDPFVEMNVNHISFNKLQKKYYDCIVLAVAHKFYLDNSSKIIELLKPNGVFYDIKGRFDFRKDDSIDYCSL